jgi:hypothetical protein
VTPYFDLLKEASAVSDRIDAAREFMRGGPLTDMLEALGEIHLRSAIEHLKQSVNSSAPHDRLLQAAADLQVAYLSFDRAASAGFRVLRVHLDSGSLAKARGDACGCAATIALIQWVVDEAPLNRRQWMDRTAHHLTEHFRDVRSRPSEFMFAKVSLNELFHDYFRFERNTLPPELVRPRPPTFVPGGKLPPGTDIYSDENYIPQYALD